MYIALSADMFETPIFSHNGKATCMSQMHVGKVDLDVRCGKFNKWA